MSALVADIQTFAYYFCKMALDAEPDRDLRDAFADLRELTVGVAYPFLLELYHEYAQGLMVKDEFLRLVRLIESYVFRRAICNIPTNSLNKTFATLAKALRKESYFESASTHLAALPSYRRFPDDEEFRRELKVRDLYNFPRRSYWLRRLENDGRKERAVIAEYTVEHILPQNPKLSQAWRDEVGPEWQRVHRKWLHTLGNLTLTGYNSEYSDKPFAEKRDMPGGFRYSPLRRWYGTFFAIDFDAHLTYDIEPFAHTHEGEGISTYLTCGTSGRGSHLYGFVEGLVPQWKVYGVVKGIQKVAEDVGLGVPEIRPSCELGRGSPIFLPYRGALKDGYGYNPLLDPRRDLEPVKLEHVLTEVQRVSDEALEKFRLKMVQQRPVRSESLTSNMGTTRKLEGADTLTVLHAEFGRVAEHFREPHRQDLVMALSAYGVRGLGLDAETVRKEVTAFVKKHDADELIRRREAIERTLFKYASNPRTVAWTPFYRSAGLTPPGKQEVSKEVLARLEVAARLLHSGAWKGLSGLSDYSVFIALLRVAAEHGTLHPSGVLVSISVRDLALRAGVGDKTVRNAIKRLRASGMVIRERRTGACVGEAGLLVIVVDGVLELPHSFPLIGGLKEWGYLYTHAAFRHSKLGKSAAPLLVTCLQEGRPLTRPELAKLLGRESRAIRSPLSKLLDHDILSNLDAAYAVNPFWEEALEHAATATGAYQTEERQRATHRAERFVFSARRGRYASGEELAKAA